MSTRGAYKFGTSGSFKGALLRQPTASGTWSPTSGSDEAMMRARGRIEGGSDAQRYLILLW